MTLGLCFLIGLLLGILILSIMGKTKNKKRSDNGEAGRPKKKQRTSGYWIDVVHDSNQKEGRPLMTVVITQVDLTDDHRYVSRDKGESKVEASKEAPIATSSLNTEIVAMEKVIAEAEPRDDDANLETPDTAGKTPENPKQIQIDYKHAFISIKRMPSASARKQKYQHKYFHPLPHGDCGDGVLNPYPKTQVADKYWAQRHRLFSRFDDDIQLDKEGWFSVTPEAIANHIAKRVAQMPRGSNGGMVVLDAFCGCGGNAIAFARLPEVSLVICVDTDLSKLQMAANNASIYNIESEKLLFVHDNAIQVLSLYSNGKKNSQQERSKSSTEEPTTLHGYSCNGPLPERLDCIFLSPPWGGTEYENVGKCNFTLTTNIRVQGGDTTAAIDGEELLTMSAKAMQHVVYFLPRNLNGIATGRSALQAGYVGTLELEKNVLNGKFKTITAYLGFDNETTRSLSE